ncbi:MAG: hypothetical protein V4651_13585 [Bacteroidota bacterium]
MKIFDDDQLLKDALKQFFAKYHFADGGYELKWFKIKVGFVYIPLPNIPSRVAVAKIHDIHHVLNEYEATLKGESEIAGWEIASGCGTHFVAWFLNLGSFFYGLFFFPRAVFKAFMLGRQVRTNYYLTPFVYNELLQQKLGNVRTAIKTNPPKPLSLSDYLSFIGYCLFTLALAGVVFYGCWWIVIELMSYLKSPSLQQGENNCHNCFGGDSFDNTLYSLYNQLSESCSK